MSRENCPEDCPRRNEKLGHPCLQGCGPKSAKIMLVGENPGKTEDAEGEPFIGRSWEHVLQPIFNEFELERDECYITNAVKCFTLKEDPKPTDKEMRRCRPYLIEEIKKVQPNVIGALGATALKAVLGRTGIKKLKNNVFWSDEFSVKVVPTFHPAWVLRNPGDYSDIRKGIRLIIDESKNPKLSNENKIPTKYFVADTAEKVDKVLTKLENKDRFSFDLETRDLHYLSTPILTLGVSWAIATGVIIPWKFFEENEEFRNRLQAVFLDKTKLKIAQNIKFDTEVFYTHKMKVGPPIWDTMLAHHTLDENSKHDLDGMVLQYTDMGEYWRDLDLKKKEICKEKKISEKEFKYDMFPKDILYPYGVKDADATFRLYKLFSKKLKEQGLAKFYKKHVISNVPIVIEMEYRGIKVDRTKLKGLIEEYKEKIKEKNEIMHTDKEVKRYETMRKKKASKKLVKKYKESKNIQSRYPESPEQYINKMLKDKDWKFNFNSPIQLRELFFEQMGLTPVKHTKTGPSTDEEVLIELESQGIEFVSKLMEFRRYTKYTSTFLEATYYGSEYDGRIHPSYHQARTVTGRYSSSDPNFQQIPRDAKDFKSCFLADEGYTFVKADLAQAEFRCWAHYSNDRDMIADIESGMDIHRQTASEVFGIPQDEVTSEQRNAAKSANFGLMYGRGANAIAQEYKIPKHQAEQLRKTFFQKYPIATDWLKETIREAKAHGQVKSWFGRIRRLPNIYSDDTFLAAEAERQALNSPVQSQASDMNNGYLRETLRRARKSGIKCFPCGSVHDANFFQVKDEHLQDLVKIMKDVVDTLYPDFRCKMKLDFEIGKTLGDLEEIE